MRALIASSTTGGHIYPALAIATEIRRRDAAAAILFVTARRVSSPGLIPSAGFEQTFIDIQGFDRKHILNNIKTAGDLIRVSFQIRRIFSDFKPDAVIGTGGYVTGPVVREAGNAGIRAFLQEQNVTPGVANKLAEKYATKVFLGFEESIPYFMCRSKLVVTGNPVRSEFLLADRDACRKQLGIGKKEQAVLVFGGSLGANAINEAAADLIANAGSTKGLHIFFITGRSRYQETMSSLEAQVGTLPERVHVMDYSDSIHEYFAAADLIVSRSGGLTVTEIAVSGRASVLVPSPNVTGNHQYYNALALAQSGAAVLMDDAMIGGGGLCRTVLSLTGDPARLKSMGEAARRASKPDAAVRIVDEIYA